jgi:hypothetical protein
VTLTHSLTHKSINQSFTPSARLSHSRMDFKQEADGGAANNLSKQDVAKTIVNNVTKIAEARTANTIVNNVIKIAEARIQTPKSFAIATFEWTVAFVAYKLSGGSSLVFFTPTCVMLGWLCSTVISKTQFYSTYLTRK